MEWIPRAPTLNGYKFLFLIIELRIKCRDFFDNLSGNNLEW